MSVHERALARILEALTALCVVVCVLALAHGDMLWSVVFALAAFCCFEVCAELEQ